MCPSGVNKKIHIHLLVLLLCLFEDVFSEASDKGEFPAEYPKGCAYLRCKRGEQCVSRKFWCQKPPCPSMLYCSKSRKDSLKGPSSCEAVRCSKGFICLVRARYCRWDEVCQQQIARCVSERDYYEGPTSCVDFRCPSGLRCILRESLCVRPPCKLLKSCADTRDVSIWHKECRNLGCLSEHECFLRRPQQNCLGAPCKHTADCSAKSEEDLEMGEQCRGWVCPKGQECSSHTKGPCKSESCRISRSCHKPLMIPVETTPVPRHPWQDNTKLNFHSKRDKNSTTPGKNHSPTRTFADKLHRVNNIARFDKKNSSSLVVGDHGPIDKEQIYKLPNPRPSSARSNVTSGRAVKPILTSLGTWLNHLKLVTGVDAIEIWIKRADRQEDHEEFLEWLQSVKDMLGSAAYDLWLEEVRAMTLTKRAFQMWLPPSPTKRTTVLHHIGRTNGSAAGNEVESKTLLDSEKPTKYPSNEGRNVSEPKGIDETVELKKNDINESKYVLSGKNEPTTKESPIINDDPIQMLPILPPTPATIGINDWIQFHSTTPKTFQQSYPLPFSPNFGDIASWNNQALPYQGFDNAGLAKPSLSQFPSNFSFQQSPETNPAFRGLRIRQDQAFSPAYPQWPQAGDPRDEIYPDPWILDPPNDPASVLPPAALDPIKYYPPNSTNQDTTWTNYFDDPYGTSRFVPPENFRSYPIADRNYVYPSWPGSDYRGQNLVDVPHHRSKHEDNEAPGFPYDNRIVEVTGEKFPDPSTQSNPYYPRFPWQFTEQTRPQDDYLNLLDYNRRILYEKNNHDGSPVLPGLSRSNRVNADPRLSQQYPYPLDNPPWLPQSEYDWTNSYPRDRLYGTITVAPSPALSHSDIATEDNERKIVPSTKLDQFDAYDEGTPGLFLNDRVNDLPGKIMELSDLWNSRYRNPTGSFLRKIIREQFGKRDKPTKDLLSTTSSPPIVTTMRTPVTPRVGPTMRTPVTPRVGPVKDENLSDKKFKNHEVNEKRFANVTPKDDHDDVDDDDNDDDDDDGDNDDDDDGDNDDDDDDDDDGDGIYPLLLSLQGYIESPSRQVFQDSSNPPKNSTILPVYTINNDRDDEFYDDDYEAQDETEGINFFRNEKYGGRADFPNNLKNIFEVEAALIIKNRTGDGNVKVKDVKWEYDDDEDLNTEDLSNLWHPNQFPVPSTDEPSKYDPLNSWTVNENDAWNDKKTKTDYYDERVDYDDENVPGDESYFDPDQINIDDLLGNDEIPDDINDSFYDDKDHKRFKKNRPL